jgi:RNA polymerase sigma factor (sigma-70 family)
LLQQKLSLKKTRDVTQAPPPDEVCWRLVGRGGIVRVVDVRDEELYEQHAAELIRFATTLVGPSHAEDVVANAVIRSMASRAWPTVAAPRAYLFRAVLNEARSVGRSDRRRIRREQTVAHHETEDAATISVEVRDAMARLSLRERSVLYLSYWHELPIAEVATTLGLSRRSTERALTDARRNLEERLS